MAKRRLTAGHTATLLVLVALLLVTCATAYIAYAHFTRQSVMTMAVGEEQARVEEARRLTLLLTILLISALLILLFVLGAYLLIHAGRVISRKALGGKPTQYVDAWQQYRLTEEQISAATGEYGPAPPEEFPPDQPPDVDEEDDPPPPTGS